MIQRSTASTGRRCEDHKSMFIRLSGDMSDLPECLKGYAEAGTVNGLVRCETF